MDVYNNPTKPDRNPLSLYHKYCVAAGPGMVDHMCVINFYENEIQQLMLDGYYYCAEQKEIILKIWYDKENINEKKY